MTLPENIERTDTKGPWLENESLWIKLLTAGLIVFALMYVRYVFMVGVNHDEVEHAQVAFRILSGELPYRNFYQNHWPAYWLLTTQVVLLFPFSIKAILVARLIGLAALITCWGLGLRLLRQIPGGSSRLAALAYSYALITLAFQFQYCLARPDGLMTLFATAGLCLVPLTGALNSTRLLILGLLFGLAISVSSKVLPMALVVPMLVFLQAIHRRSFAMLFTVFFYAAGVVLALLPTLLWLAGNDLLDAFYFDVFGLNLALSKPWQRSFGFLQLAVYLPAILGVLAWFYCRRQQTVGQQNGFRVVLLALLCGWLMAYTARHGAIYQLQSTMVPMAVAFASLVTFLSMQIRDPAPRMLLVTALLAYPVSSAATVIVLFKGNSGTPHAEVQAIIDLAKPGGRNCIAFSPSHPIWCHSISQLSNVWDLLFAKYVTEPEQLERLHNIWQEGLERTLELQPDIILRYASKDIWQKALDMGLIRQQDLDALDRLAPLYEKRFIGENEFWIKKNQKIWGQENLGSE